MKPFDLRATSGLVRTSAGIIAYIIWSISSGDEQIAELEHYLNPFEMQTIRMLSGVAQQTHLKVVIVDSSSSEVVGFKEMNNNYDLGKLAAGIAQTVGNEPVADFRATRAALQAEFSLEDLKRSS